MINDAAAGQARSGVPLDLQRPRKQTLVVLDIRRGVRPAVSPDDPDQVLELLRERVAA